MTKIISQIMDQIKRHPHINKVIVSKVEWLLIKRKIRHSSWVRPAKRPTGNIKNNPWLHIDQNLWDANFKHMRDLTPIEIMGRPVIYREQNEASD